MIYWVEVTAEDIRLGLRRSSLNCPVALALRRATGRPTLEVGTNVIFQCWPVMGGELVTNPPSVSRFVSQFDAGRPVEPFSFQVELPDAIPEAVATPDIQELVAV